ncbi:MAG: outer membrane beta-barrel protein [Planctomycetota bacterium]
MKKTNVAWSLLATVLLGSCASAPDWADNDKPKKWHVRGGAAVHDSKLEDEFGGDADGVNVAGRVEVARSLEYLDHQAEAGLRLNIGVHDAENSDGLPVEFDSFEVYLEPVIRAYVGRQDKAVRPYVEGFIGFGYADADATATFPGIGPVSDSEDGYLFTLGTGAGVEFNLGSNWTLSAGPELRWTRFETDRFETIEGVDLGGAVMFGARW